MNAWLMDCGSSSLIPFIAPLAGLPINWLAIKMTFHLLEYVGMHPYGGRRRGLPASNKFAFGILAVTIGLIGSFPHFILCVIDD